MSVCVCVRVNEGRPCDWKEAKVRVKRSVEEAQVLLEDLWLGLQAKVPHLNEQPVRLTFARAEQ